MRPATSWLVGLAVVATIAVVVLLGVRAVRDGDDVGDVPVLTVATFVAARDAGALPAGSFVVGGFWSVLGLAHSCAPPSEPLPGVLELYCADGESGITHLDEPIMRTNGNQVMPASGPSMTPYVPDEDLRRILFAHHERPVRIVVAGHVDDPLAQDCRPQARQLCRDRFVVEHLLLFDG